MKRVFFYMTLLMALTAAWAQESAMGEINEVQNRIQAIAAMVANKSIGRVEILQIPPEVLTDGRVTAEILERSFHYKLIIRDVRLSAHEDRLPEAIRSATVKQQEEAPDLRWALIFYDADNKRVEAIYLDKYGKSGAVGDIPVSFKGDLFKWLIKNFSKCFR